MHATQPPDLVEAKSSPVATPGAPISVASLTVTGTATTYDTAALTAPGSGWIDRGNGHFAKEGLYGTAVLDTVANTLTYFLDNAKADSLKAGATA